jgi:hypothetical protein
MKSQKAKKPGKAEKPYPDFPLFLHQTGQWAKKVRGKLHYFGTDAALAKYMAYIDARLIQDRLDDVFGVEKPPLVGRRSPG